MYSVVMMLAMSGTPDMAAFGGRGCRGGNGCGGYAGSCWGGNGYGCNGGGCHGGRGGFFGKHHGGRGGCHGYGGGCNGYGGGCYGYGGGCGCCGSGYGYGCAGGGGCWGGGYAAPTGGGVPAMQVMPAPAGAPAKGAMIAAPANIVINLPADAKLTFDGIATSSTSNVRKFVTPTLNPGTDYTYTLAIEAVRDGKTMNATQVVTVRSGETTEVNFGENALTVASK